jgi:hypothetical protein
LTKDGERKWMPSLKKIKIKGNSEQKDNLIKKGQPWPKKIA